MKWETVSLGDLALRKGGAVDPKKHPDEVFELYSIPAFDAGAPEVAAGSKIGSSKKAVQPNDVMISRIVPHIRRSCVVGQSNGLRQIASGEWIIFRSDGIWPQYLRWVLIGDVFHSAFMQTVSGVGGSLLRARPAEVFKIKVPLPPLAKQKRIAGILDAADALRAKRRESLTQLDALLQSTFLEMFGDPVTNPMGWEFAPITEAVDGKYGIKAGPFGSALKKEDYVASGFRVYGQEQVIAGRFDIGDYYIDERKFKKLGNCAVTTGDILVSLVGTFGKVLIVPDGIEPGVINPRLLKITPRQELVTSLYLATLIQNEATQRKLESMSHGGTMGIINAGLLKQLTIPTPPIDLQHRFASIVESVEQQKSSQRAHLDELDTLFASLQSRAFQGDL